jgi:hypothetical protein
MATAQVKQPVFRRNCNGGVVVRIVAKQLSPDSSFRALDAKIFLAIPRNRPLMF